MYPDHRTLYRLPWSLTDNPIAWLEVTSACNIYCQGCYRANVKDGHKSLAAIEAELDVFEKFRNFDGVSIAGGDPLVHPDIVAVVEAVARRGFKPILNTNGVALTDDLLTALARAGLKGFTFHVDSKQGRPGWKRPTEADLNVLRLDLAQRVSRAGDIACAFNATVYEDTLDQVPDILAWAREHMDIVHVVVFIAFRQASETVRENMEFFVGDRRVSLNDVVYSRRTGDQRLDISSRDVVAAIREWFPDFAPCAYLNGTENPESLKWLLTTAFGDLGRVYGYAGPRFMELAQVSHHVRTGRYMAYGAPSLLHRGGRIAAAGAWFDAGVRSAWRRYLAAGAWRPWRLFRGMHVQSVMIIQPIDVTAHGHMDMCDACPDMTVHDGELVWSCRLEERMKYGDFAARAVVRRREGEPASRSESMSSTRPVTGTPRFGAGPRSRAPGAAPASRSGP